MAMIVLKDMVKLKKLLEPLTKDDILKPYISDQDFRLTNVKAAGEPKMILVLIYMFLIHDIRKI